MFNISYLNQWFVSSDIPNNSLHGVYHLDIVALSYIIAVLASYVALDMSAQLKKNSSYIFRVCWLSAGSFIMGLGIWSMHFIGMLAFTLPVTISYDIYWTAISMFTAVVTSALAFFFFTIKKPKAIHYLASGILLGATIPTMHYTGMMGIEHVHIQYKPELFFLSICIAIIAAVAGLRMAVASDHDSFKKRIKLKFISALIMGFAVSGMHYMGMAAAIFTPSNDWNIVRSINPSTLAMIISSAVISILMISVLLSSAKYFFSTMLENKNKLLAAVFNNMRGGVVACDSDGNITLINRTTLNLFGDISSIDAKKFFENCPLYKTDIFRQISMEEYPLCRALNGQKIRNEELLMYDIKGKRRILTIDGQQIINDANENLGAMLVFYDISEQKQNEAELIHQATHDALTGLPNRILLLDRMCHAISSAERSKLKLIVAFLDLDRFKHINDALGHSIGDLLLKEVSQRLSTILRKSDTLARIGGDEFIIILPEQKDIYPIQRLINEILNQIAKPYLIGDHELSISCSIGLSVYPTHGTDPETLLKNADNAMYQAKEAGKNTFRYYTSEMQARVKTRMDLENGLRKAIIHNEFFLEYQPKLDIKSNVLIGFEALLRWQHPELGRIPPDSFIYIAEESGLILPIGEWVLNTACAQNQAWQDAGMAALCISVNVSARQCSELSFVKTVKNCLKAINLHPSCLELELTESLAMINPENFLKLLFELKSLGVKTSIDDFGAGYSSLKYLRQFPVNSLKIDPSFIKELETQKDDFSIVKAIITLAHSLDMTVIAEGVETSHQLSQLKENDCDQIQGYIFCEPISAEAVLSFYKEHNTKKAGFKIKKRNEFNNSIGNM